MFKTLEDLDQYLKDCETVDYAYPIEEMTPREKMKAAYSEEVGNKVRWAVNDAIEFFSNLECVMDKKEIKKVINKLEKANESKNQRIGNLAIHISFFLFLLVEALLYGVPFSLLFRLFFV